jgi:hypothetical protein
MTNDPISGQYYKQWHVHRRVTYQLGRLSHVTILQRFYLLYTISIEVAYDFQSTVEVNIESDYCDISGNGHLVVDEYCCRRVT